MSDKNNVALHFENITKSFKGVRANDGITFDLMQGEILALLGENGSGKTSLMNMCFGIYTPDDGEIYVRGEKAVINSPKDAFSYGIGMIHQHFKLVDIFTATENIVLGIEEEKYNIKKSAKKVEEISSRYGFDIDPNKKIYDMSVSEKQSVEIIKVLYRGADILILDEPTAVLTPQETSKLFDVLRKMRDDGKSIIIITHKLHEVLALSDRVAILRKGKYVATVNTAQASESLLTEMMVGENVALEIGRTEPKNCTQRLIVNNLGMVNHEGISVLDDISFSVFSGEILGIAGIAGSGQRELLDSIAGLSPVSNGEIMYIDPISNEKIDLRQKTPIQIRDLGVRLSFVPEDRLGMGLVGNMDIVDNMMLRSYQIGHSPFLNRIPPKNLAQRIVDSLQVKTPSVKTPVRTLSGGNVQKVLVGREIAAAPTLLMAAYPVRGLDVNSSYMIYNILTAQKDSGVAVIFVGEDLDVLLGLCDRIMVMSCGKISGIVDARTAKKEEIGLLMTKGREGDTNDKKQK